MSTNAEGNTEYIPYRTLPHTSKAQWQIYTPRAVRLMNCILLKDCTHRFAMIFKINSD